MSADNVQVRIHFNPKGELNDTGVKQLVLEPMASVPQQPDTLLVISAWMAYFALAVAALFLIHYLYRVLIKRNSITLNFITADNMAAHATASNRNHFRHFQNPSSIWGKKGAQSALETTKSTGISESVQSLVLVNMNTDPDVVVIDTNGTVKRYSSANCIPSEVKVVKPPRKTVKIVEATIPVEEKVTTKPGNNDSPVIEEEKLQSQDTLLDGASPDEATKDKEAVAKSG